VSRLVVVGDALLDRDVEGISERLAPDAPVPVLERSEGRLRPGGAALAAAIAARDGRPVTLVAAFAADDAAAELSRALLAAGVDLVGIPLAGATAEKVRFLDRGRPLMRLDRGGGEVEAGGLEPTLRAALAGAAAILVSDYGAGVAAAPEVRRALAERPAGVPLVWDPHPRGAAPVRGTDLATPNLAEARALTGSATGSGASPGALAGTLVRRWSAAAACVTCGEDGAALATAGGERVDFAVPPETGDPCGAGDCFAASVARALADGAPIPAAVSAATGAAADFVAESGARAAMVAPSRTQITVEAGEALAVADRVRAAGGTVVATGGCFDLLHLGHVRSLEAARRLGDCLVVLLNGDRSVRELKGADRPLIGQDERAAMLASLSCVDAVTTFDESDPTEALAALRPDVWAKGGDYQVDELPEAKAIATWGGRIAILPYLEGRSTTKLIEEVSERVGS
jgi:D-beta-D-heptose 7-phosphate kinase / D-beta-D-heptose 1-phosphate adenosyltransferase